MGDMKTPDFDDLLAAFDIPDMVDPKAAIESGHDDLRPSMPQEDETTAPSSVPDVGVSVIVKNIRNMDTTEHAQMEKEVHSCVTVGNGPQNGFPTMSPSNQFVTNSVANLSSCVEGCGQTASNPSTFTQFSPISSAEEFDDDDKIEVDDPVEQQITSTCFRSDSVAVLPIKREEQTKNTMRTESLAKPGSNGSLDVSKTDKNNNYGILVHSRLCDSSKTIGREDQAKELVPKPLEGRQDGEHPGLATPSTLSKTKSLAKLSSCIAAIAALSAKKATADTAVCESLAPQRVPPKEARTSPRGVEKLPEQESALEVAKRLLSKQPDSPSSITSEGSSKGSVSSPTGSTPVIPKVRIKTIKTSSGQIKRTVTRVLPEFDPEGLIKGESNASIVVSSIVSSPITTLFSTQTQTSMPTTVVATSRGSTMEITKQMTIKPLATAFLPVSAVKTAGSQIINLKLANNTTVKATVIPATSVQSASSAILKAANAIQQQTVMVPASSLANAKLVPKTVQLTNLNLLPQAASASEVHQILSKPLQQQPPIKQALLAAQVQTQAPKKVSRVQVLASSQSSVVEAFNKVLSSINPVPVYVPNLSPPFLACISLPTRGYKCLECGDSFALEKSLTQHYDRRSVRIEVTCNHCVKNLVFYNKCSLLSHARGHKDKGDRKSVV